MRQRAVSIIEDPDTGLMLDVTPWKISRVLMVADFEANTLHHVIMDVDIVRFTLEVSTARGV